MVKTAAIQGSWAKLRRIRDAMSDALASLMASVLGIRGGRAIVIALGGLVVASGLFLLVRPLTTLLVLVGAAAALCALVALRLLLVPGWGLARMGIAAALLFVVIAILLWLPEAVRALPLLCSVALLLNAIRLAAVSVIGDRPRHLLTRGAWAVSSGIFAVLCWLWQDLATLAIAAVFALGLVVLGLVLLRAGVRTSGDSEAKAPRSRPVLHGVVGVVVLMLAVSAAWGSFQLRLGVAVADDFTVWNEAIPDAPGTVLRVEPYLGTVPEGADAVRLLYTTTYSDGRPAVASAVVAIPRTPDDHEAPVLAWQHGTTGVARGCAPSLGTAALTEYAIPGISEAVDRGWIVVATDYPGQGTGGRYPYLIGEGEARATLDAIRAASRIDGVHASSAAWLWGHSQGGHATLWAGEIVGRYAPEIDLLGVAALSAASDPLALAERVTAADASALSDVVTSFVLVPYVDEYDDLRLGESVHPAGHGIVEAFASRCVTEAPTLVSLITGAALSWDAPLYGIELEAGSVHDRLVQNIADGIVPAPLFMGQGTADEVIPIEMQRSLHESLCEAGRTVDTHEYPGRTHMGVIAEGAPLIDDLFDWADRVAAGESPSSCAD